MSNSKIGTINAIFLCLSIAVAYVTSSLPKTLINETRSSILLNLLYVTFIVLLVVLLICKLFKKFPGLDILDISKFLGGNVFKNIVGLFFVAFFIITCSMMLRNLCEGLVVVYYPLTNHVFLVLAFIISIAFVNRLGFNSTINVTSIVFPIVFISVILLFLGNLENFSFQRVFPVLGNGFNDTFVLGLKNIGLFAGVAFLYFLPPMLKEPEKLKKISIVTVICTGVFIILCVATLLFMFSFYSSSDEIIPLFSAARHIEFGTFFQRFESVFLLIWIVSFCCFLSVSCKFSTHIFNKMFNLSDTKPVLNLFTILIFAFSLLPKNYSISNLYETNIYRYFGIMVVFVLSLSVLILANIKKNRT